MAIDALYSPLQQRVLRFAMTKDFFMLINHGAKRSGKTIVDNDLFIYEIRRVRAMADKLGIKKPQYILCSTDLSSLHRNVLHDLTEKYDLQFKFDRFNRFELYGVTICCFGHSTIDNLGRIRGMTAWGAYINEATMCNEEVFNEIKSRCSAPGARLIMDTNPDRPGHWLKTKYIDKADFKENKIAHFKWKLTDNTFIGQEYINNQMNSTASGLFYDRDINGLWVAAEGAVYSDFDRNVHYIKTEQVPKHIVQHWCGQDFGWEHPGAIVLLGRDEYDNVYLLKEWSAKHRSIEEWASIITDEIYPEVGYVRVYCDSARPDLIYKLQCSGIDAVNAKKDVVAGIGAVATRFKNKTLYVVEENVDLFKTEIETYVWKKGVDEPVKKDDDVMDALRYGIYSEKVENDEAAMFNDAVYLKGGW